MATPGGTFQGGSTPSPRSDGNYYPQGNVPDPFKGPGRVTSARRTPKGNALVGGVQGSRHLSGDAVDVVGASASELRKYYGPNAKISWHKDHHHIVVPGARFPYYGKRGTAGL